MIDMGDDSSQFPYPTCLSSIILRLADILINPDENLIKGDYRVQIIRLISLCLQEQRCLMFKMPFFVLNFLTSNMTTSRSRLEYLKMVTKDGRQINEAFAPKIFLVVNHLLDLSLRSEDNSLLEVCDFLKTLFDYNPDTFDSTQTLLILTRICLLGFQKVHDQSSELPFEVLQII